MRLLLRGMRKQKPEPVDASTCLKYIDHVCVGIYVGMPGTGSLFGGRKR